MVWVGIDVGDRGKGFHVAVIGSGRVEPSHWVGADAATALAGHIVSRDPLCVGIDAPAEWAPAGASSRPEERAFAATGVCGIRYTPDAVTARARSDRYYGWIEHGLELWAALAAHDLPCVEVFPTASWTRWLGPRVGRSRATWTRTGLTRVAGDLDGLELATNQDLRDAVAAALTARQATTRPDTVARFGPLTVPV